MASLKLDEFGDLFVNVSQSVGTKKANTAEDVLVVQALLAIVYNENPRFKAQRPTKGPAVVSSRLEPGTPTLIAHFQRTVLKRPKPQGFINHARASGRQLQFSTIFKLNSEAQATQVFVNRSGESVVDRLKREHPSLASLSQETSEIVITPRPERARESHLIDSSR
jgi:hypothetical protein